MVYVIADVEHISVEDSDDSDFYSDNGKCLIENFQ